MVKPHRVPESVFDVEFKLFDLMSMKQFVIVMVTAGFAVLLYFLLDKITAAFIKWLIVLTVVTIGLVVAFLKLQGEPFEVYVTNFILALVSPQRRVWSKTNELPEYLKDSTKTAVQQVTDLEEKARKAATPSLNQETLKAITAVKISTQPTTELDIIEKEYLEGKLPMIGAVTKTIPPAQPVSAPASPPLQQITSQPITQKVQTLPSQSIQVPVQVPHTQMNITEQLVSVESLNNSTSTPPQAALRANVLSGEVYSTDNKPLTTAIINIRQENGSITRALTSNALGQFVSSDPLQNGKYMIELVKPGYMFPKYKIECNGNLIPSKRYLGQQK